MASEMLMERSRRDSQLFSNGFLDDLRVRPREADVIPTIPVSSSLSPSSSSRSSSPSSTPGSNCIHHRVSKMDTLAGVAIKYGVEVADIKKLNGLVTDLQMFAHKSLQIPLPGRHPPSPSPFVCNDSVENGENSPLNRPCNDVLDLIETFNLKSSPSNVSPAMSRLQGYYGLTSFKRGYGFEGTEMAVYKAGRCCMDEELTFKESPTSALLQTRHRKSRSLVGLISENGDKYAVLEAADNTDCERYVRRRQKTDESLSYIPELWLKDDNNCGFLGRTGKGLAPRPKLGFKADTTDVGRTGAVPTCDNVKTEAHASVRKSSSTSCLQDPENNFSMWSGGKWILNPDVIAKPIFDGFPKSIGARKTKTALD
ncbi:hypothetical protein Cni_G07594 [Canna indica]|uniref:LysM domain-containing protein n=1 Tax=Canna indica TaxID=4628 RepID=A0AAQ3K1F0_9LILI|nr:hypothetical protein Cni_G07594 [Canna indica]